MYSRTFFSKDDIQNHLVGKIEPVALNKVLSAFEMADNIYNDNKLPDGTPYFFHTTRVSKIIINELEIYDHELIIGALLHDITKTSNDFNSDILTFNFGEYVAFLIDILQSDYTVLEERKREIGFFESKNLEITGNDYLIIWLAEHLDMIRCLDMNINVNPLSYLKQVSNMLPFAENSSNKSILKLVDAIKKERNKFYC